MPSNANKTKNLVERDKQKQDVKNDLGDRLSDLLDKSVGNSRAVTNDKFVMTAAELAKKASISPGTISSYRTSAREPGAAHLKRMAEVLGVTADYLLGMSDIPKGSAEDMAIEQRFGLSAEAIETLDRHKALHDKNKGPLDSPLDLLNSFLSYKKSEVVFREMAIYFEKVRQEEADRVGSKEMAALLQTVDISASKRRLWEAERVFGTIIEEIIYKEVTSNGRTQS